MDGINRIYARPTLGRRPAMRRDCAARPRESVARRPGPLRRARGEASPCAPVSDTGPRSGYQRVMATRPPQPSHVTSRYAAIAAMFTALGSLIDDYRPYPITNAPNAGRATPNASPARSRGSWPLPACGSPRYLRPAPTADDGRAARGGRMLQHRYDGHCGLIIPRMPVNELVQRCPRLCGGPALRQRPG